MINKPAIFTRNRPNLVTKNRLKTILNYVIDCYLHFEKDNVIHNKKHLNKINDVPFEEFLRTDFVENYLKKLKSKYLKKRETDRFLFEYETEKYYVNSKGGDAKDQIDIFVNNLGIEEDVWGITENNIYYAIECKIFNSLSDCKHYQGDINKFCQRQYKQFRLPFEGMIGFVFSPSILSQPIVDKLNISLKNSTQISTKKYLERLEENINFKHHFQSIHRRNHTQKLSFTIDHLFFDYSKKVVL